MSEKTMSVKEIDAVFKDTDINEYPSLCERFSSDDRKGVKKLIQKYHKQYQAYLIECKRIDNMKRKELDLIEQGYRIIAGIDEVGRGPLCGPVVSAAVIMPKDSKLLYVNDSKQLTEKKREELYDAIMQEAVSVGIGIVDNQTIDRINILNATKLSMEQAVDSLNTKPDLLILDAVTLDLRIPQKSFVKGDENFYSIAAASIIAKVTRDRMMHDYAKIYPEYSLDSNKGYGAQVHIEAIRLYGITPIHRKSFVSNIVQNDSTYTIGHRFEQIAKQFLIDAGYEIVSENYKRAGGEIDLICKEGDVYVFCEVKARSVSDINDPKEYVDRAKQENLIRTAEKYMAEKAIFDTGRFDVIAISYQDHEHYEITHHQNAF